MAWTQYMTLTLEKLNALTAGTDHERKDTKAILIATAREPAEAPIFNYASMAHNNARFFDGLSPTPVEIPAHLKRGLEASFSSIETLRREFVLTASAMFGPGFVWLVKVGNSHASGLSDNFRIVTTYLAGSPYPGAHWRQQATDMNTVGGASAEGHGAVAEYFRKQGNALQRAPPSNSRDTTKLAPGGIDVIPLLCLNTWEHVWLRDYGMGAGGYGGKRAFAEAWWETIDWNRVTELANISKPAFRV